MSYLAKLKQIENQENFENIPESVLPKLPKPPFGSFGSKDSGENKKHIVNIGAITAKQVEMISALLKHIGEPEVDHSLVLNKCNRDPEALTYYLERANEYAREKRRQKVLSILESNPYKLRAYSIDTTTENDIVILTVAIRGVASFETLIPKVSYDPFLFIKMIENESLQ